jgi:hypothetical protein
VSAAQAEATSAGVNIVDYFIYLHLLRSNMPCTIMHGASHRLVSGLVFHACAVQMTESADGRNKFVISCRGRPLAFRHISPTSGLPLGGLWQAEFNLQVPIKAR